MKKIIPIMIAIALVSSCSTKKKSRTFYDFEDYPRNSGKIIPYELNSPIFIKDIEVLVMCTEIGESSDPIHGGTSQFRKFLIQKENTHYHRMAVTGCCGSGPMPFEYSGTNYVIDIEPSKYGFFDNYLRVMTEDDYWTEVNPELWEWQKNNPPQDSDGCR